MPEECTQTYSAQRCSGIHFPDLLDFLLCLVHTPTQQTNILDMSPQLVILAYYAGCVNLAIATTPLCASAAHCVGIAVDQTTMLETERKS